MTTSNKKTRNGQLTSDQAMIAGTQKFLTKYPTLPVGSQEMAPADIVKVFQDRIGTSTAVTTADAARTAAIKADRDERQKTSAFLQAFRRMVLGMFMQSPDTLATFGLKPPKATKTTVATKSTAVAKSKATRTARGTMGSKQKKAVTGASATTATGGSHATPPAAPTKPAAP